MVTSDVNPEKSYCDPGCNGYAKASNKLCSINIYTTFYITHVFHRIDNMTKCLDIVNRLNFISLNLGENSKRYSFFSVR